MSRRQAAVRPGVTLVEVLVVISICSFLLALGLPAIQSAREASRRLSCMNHFRQVGLALHNYSAALGSFPPAVIWSPPGEPLGAGTVPIGVIDRVARTGDPDQDTVYANWLIMLLPQLEQGALAVAFDGGLPMAHERNRRGRATSLAVLKCPSDPANDEGREYLRGLAAGLSTNAYARGNIAINVGPDRRCLEGLGTKENPCVEGFIVRGANLMTDNVAIWGSGIAGANRSFSPRDVTDGMSNTVALDEIRAGLGPLDPRGAWALGQIGASAVARHGLADGVGGPNLLNVPDEFIGCGKLTQQLQANGTTALEQGMPCDPATLDFETNTLCVPRSLHPRGIVVGLCDGSAQFLHDTIDSQVWQALHTRNRADGMLSPF